MQSRITKIIKIPYNSNLKVLKIDTNFYCHINENRLKLKVLKNLQINNTFTNKLIIESNDRNKIELQERLIKQNFLGLIQGFKLKLILTGIGYKYFIRKNKLYFKLNRSHLICFTMPQNLEIYQLNSITLILKSSNLELLMDFSKKLKTIIKSNAFKKKGIFISTEKIKLKSKNDKT